MPVAIVRVKFANFNVGEKVSASDEQIKRWEAGGVAVRVPGETKAVAKAPENKMVTVAETAKAEDEQPAYAYRRRGPGRPRKDD